MAPFTKGPPPTYAFATSPLLLKVNLKQDMRRSRHCALSSDSQTWARLLGVAISREWLHSSGVPSIHRVLITDDMSFKEFHARVRERLVLGVHGGPWQRLQWAYLLRGSWLGAGQNETCMLVGSSTWHEAKAAMRALLDARVDLVFTMSRRGRLEMPPPSYSDLDHDKY